MKTLPDVVPVIPCAPAVSRRPTLRRSLMKTVETGDEYRDEWGFTGRRSTLRRSLMKTKRYSTCGRGRGLLPTLDSQAKPDENTRPLGRHGAS